MSVETSFPAITTTSELAGRAKRPALRAAGRVVLAGLAIGVLAQLLFFGMRPGVNVPLAVAALLIAAWRVRPPATPLRAIDAWLPAAAVVYASFVALRDDPTLIAVDLLVTLALLGASLAAIGGMTIVTRPLMAVAGVALQLAAHAMAAAVNALGDARSAIPRGGLGLRLGGVAPVLRGLLIGLPLVAVFVALFAAADAVFARIVGDIFRIDLDLGDATARILLALLFGWLATGALAFVADDRAKPPAEAASGRRGWLGTTEAVTVLLVVDAVFLFFVALQAAYLFGGLDTLAAAGLTYAEYARRGYFELIGAAVLAGGLLLVLEHLVARRTWPYLAAAVGLALCTAVILASAFLRLRLYQDAYGWTELRFYAVAGIVWLAVYGALTIGALLTDRTRWLPNALVVWALVLGLGINVIGPVRFVAEQNLARAVNPSLVPEHGSTGLDYGYLNGLGTDAVLPMADALPNLRGSTRQDAVDVLSRRLDELRRTPDAWQEWNLSRLLARDAD